MPYWQKYTRIFLPLNLFLIWISILFFYDAKPVYSSESRPMAIMGPLITTGSVDETTQQILFDRLREHLLQRFMLVSHVIVDSIRERIQKHRYRKLPKQQMREHHSWLSWWTWGALSNQAFLPIKHSPKRNWNTLQPETYWPAFSRSYPATENRILPEL